MGVWAARKGVQDWASIANSVWMVQPEVEFRFLGTGLSEAAVRADLHVGLDTRVEVVPHFEAEELPGLLVDADVGAFPSYVEGLPIGVLEQLAAGIPVVAYDVPGSRQLLRPLVPNLLVGGGDTRAMAERLVSLLDADEADCAGLVVRCRSVATGFTWAAIAPMTIDAYRLAKVVST